LIIWDIKKITVMNKDLKRMLELWKMKNPSIQEINEFYELCNNYPYLDSIELINK